MPLGRASSFPAFARDRPADRFCSLAGAGARAEFALISIAPGQSRHCDGLRSKREPPWSGSSPGGTMSRIHRLSGNAFLDGRERKSEAFRHGFVREAAAMDVQSRAQMRILDGGRNALARQSQAERQGGVIQRLA
jgi:hypothetical protein